MRISYDNGRGASDRWLYVIFGNGRGYIRKWYVNLCAGPGKAVMKRQNCGHKGLKHCNSTHCKRMWCNVQKIPVFGWLFVKGHTLRIWCGPVRGSWFAGYKNLRRKKKSRNNKDGLCSVVSFI